ncbi:hypothetical protein, variant [Exophiala sideris]|uniref:Uncharacterized protein n=1 Tax=Exophiala sideris TaxID=1016849 RepID=A0A0D1YZJ6_9EURO|nr:hypothetical protein, variant [Exophiala sideris]
MSNTTAHEGTTKADTNELYRLFGFLLGSTLAGASVYYYILEEYKVSNELLTEDIYALQAAVQRIHSYVTELENKVSQIKK